MARTKAVKALTDEDKIFAWEIAKGAAPAAAATTAYGQGHGLNTRDLLERDEIARFIEVCKKPGDQIAIEVFREEMLTGTPQGKRAAAEKFLKHHGEKDKDIEAFQRWTAIMTEAGAKVVIPPHAQTVELTFESFLRGDAHLHLPFEAKVKILHMAGAPWNERDPHASLSGLQLKILKREERELLVLGGSGLGKSSLGGMFGVLEALVPGRNVAVVAATYKHVSHEFDYIIKGLKRLFGDLVNVSFPVFKNTNREKYADFHIETLWKTTVKGYSVDNQEGISLLGSGFDLVIMGEGDLIPTGVYNRKILRAMDRRAMRTGPGYRTGRAVIFTTPAFGEGCASSLYERIMRDTNGDPEEMHYPNVAWPASVWMTMASVLENPSYDRQIYEERKRTLMKEDPQAFLEQYEGKIQRRANLVLNKFNPVTNIIEMPKHEHMREMRFGIGIDPGSKFACVLVGLDRNRRFYTLGEHYAEMWTVQENTDAIKEMCVDVLAPAFGGGTFDEVRHVIDAFWIDVSSEQQLEIEQALDVTLDASKLDLEGSISHLNELMANSMFFVVDRCEQWIKDANRYTRQAPKDAKWAPGERSDKVRKMYDHLADATRYILFGLENVGPTTEERKMPSFHEAFEAEQRQALFDDMRGVRRESGFLEGF